MRCERWELTPTYKPVALHAEKSATRPTAWVGGTGRRNARCHTWYHH